MPVPISQMWTVASYVLGQKIKQCRKYPLVLMLEPLMRCNLSCAGCGKIQYPSHIFESNLRVEESLDAAEECGAPVVGIEAEDGTRHEGYVSNADPTSIELWPNHSARQMLPVESIRSLHFSGKDMAEGPSYQVWIKKWQAKANQSGKGAIA